MVIEKQEKEERMNADGQLVKNTCESDNPFRSRRSSVLCWERRAAPRSASLPAVCRAGRMQRGSAGGTAPTATLQRAKSGLVALLAWFQGVCLASGLSALLLDAACPAPRGWNQRAGAC